MKICFVIITVRTVTMVCSSCFVQGDCVHLSIKAQGVTQHYCMETSASLPLIKQNSPSWNGSGTVWPRCGASVFISCLPPRPLILLFFVPFVQNALSSFSSSTCFSSTLLHSSSPLFTCSSVTTVMATVVTVIMLQLGQPVPREGKQGIPNNKPLLFPKDSLSVILHSHNTQIHSKDTRYTLVHEGTKMCTHTRKGTIRHILYVGYI